MSIWLPIIPNSLVKMSHSLNSTWKLLFLKDFYLFLERGEQGKRGRETSMCDCLSRNPSLGTWPSIQACVLTGNGTSGHLIHRPALNPLSHTSQGKKTSFRETNVGTPSTYILQVIPKCPYFPWQRQFYMFTLELTVSLTAFWQM